MIKEFEEGEAYTNPKLDRDIFVQGIGLEAPDAVTLAILWVDRETTETNGFGELVVKRADFADWSIKEYD